jgi:hypothetical protein
MGITYASDKRKRKKKVEKPCHWKEEIDLASCTASLIDN